MKKIIIKKEIPPIYDRLHQKFGIKWDDGVIIAYDGAIWCKENLEPQKIIHENKHIERQKEIGNDAWWQLYLDNDVFRLEEEVVAYRAELEFIKRHIKNREMVFHAKRDIAENLSSSIYGNMVTKQEAMKLL